MITSQTEWTRRNLVLKEWEGQRVKIKGIFEKYVPRDRNGVALVQDIEVELPNHVTHDIGHAWIQKAKTLETLKEGDRFTATCRVSTYVKQNGTLSGNEFCNLIYPNDVQLLSPPVVMRQLEMIPAPVPPTLPAKKEPERDDPFVTLINKGRKLVDTIGKHNLQLLRGFVLEIGGWDKLEAFLKLID